MKKRFILKIFTAMLCIASSYTWARKIPILKPVETNVLFKYRSALALSSYDLDPLIIISQNMYEKGLVVIKGNFQKPNTIGDVKVTIKYRDNQNNWVSVWCRTFAGNYRYDEDLTANFELPSSALNVQSVKIELSSNKNITNWESIVWNKTISHYRHSDYVYGNCNLDENQIFINPVTEECPVSCFTVNAGAVSDFADWSKAPNSYIFTGKDKKTNADVDGLYIPVKKAYKMWESNPLMGGSPIPSGTVSADVYWEDIHGLIKSGDNYSLEITGSGEEAKIKVPINKTKEGNAVIAYRVNGEIFWSWHIWVTDDPTNGSTYKSFDGVKRQRADGTVELIPDSDWGWMDRNLGALSNTITGTEFNKNGGLLYQWGRKDPIPPLAYKGNDFYEASGSVGRIRHRQSRNMANGSQKIDNLIKTVTLSNATVPNNLRLSVKNPLSLIYVNKDDNSGQALYNNNASLQVNWFGNSTTLPANRLSELNLWSDNSKGFITNGDLSNDNSANPYRDKSPFDPCPNGWRIPSVLVSNLGNGSYIDNVRVDFSPFGIKNSIAINTFEANKYHIIKPNDNNTPDFMKGFKIYNNVGIDLSNVGGNNMGIFPGTGMLVRGYHEGQYTDQHETYLWTATMTRFFDATPSISARIFRMIPDRDQPDVPDPSLPSITGRYQYYPLAGGVTSAAHGCRCIKDPLYEVNNYNFPTEFFNNAVEYGEGLNNPNSYTIVKNTVESTIQIPISKAFSAQSKLLNNPDILNPSNFNNLKVNVLWSTATGLISNIALSNTAPASLADISNTTINVKIAPNQSGNAVVTLHNGSITNSIYWSWHIWVTNTPISSATYVTELPNQAAVNYINYIKPGEVIKTEIMDRDLGANQAIAEANKTTSTGGLHYQWGRKDPLPVFVNANRNSIPVYLGTVQANGSVSYTILPAATYYSDSYLKKYPDYSVQANVLGTDKVADKISKVLSYSVKNPMTFMVPNMTTKSADTNHTNGADWLADEPNLAPERWGRGGKKSPFDPCPEGWRIPDLTGVSNTSIGATPFYKPTTGMSIPNNYGGTRINRNPYSSAAIAYSFNYAAYNIGSFANLGVRGGRNTIEALPASPDFNAIDYVYGGFWLGALGSNYTGRALRTEIQYIGNYLIPFSSNADPYFAQNCRCVKVKYDENGNELGPIPKLQVTSLSAVRATNVLAKSVIEDKIGQNKLEVFPNPVKSKLYIKGNDGVREYYYQIYNTSGEMVKSGKFENDQTDLSSLLSGAYLVRINNSETIVKIIKE
ncbi:T9SS C-terminal target domain-containing protein [Chryseobacterium bernardetii]|uniref:T9SS C-terminal target domain-containing protein n=1 Tax=Chryseobacterium bernardetii TaxID=1241978 RepID=A0A3G6T371_9FLAO|nr:T9SS type A sorting domain-containing protein [Chryseobacterium bernardetii]AZB23822.1 T9SS C-terminal target domain-containing protein [Chryseobacterium bernardetii]